ncbi:transposase [Candidatus Poriferisodalis sp.]|uniref:transposase n=1 Tax=Candidatus Poriferisodalis sp. TaxID=3101277 RepID=UPI003B02510D
MRQALPDEQWKRIEPLLPPQRGRGRPYEASHWVTLEGILWIARRGAPWRDLPERYGQRFRRWSHRGVFERLLQSLDSELDFGTLQIDGMFIKVHQHARGARRRKRQGLPCDPRTALTKQSEQAEEAQPPKSSHLPTDRAGS